MNILLFLVLLGCLLTITFWIIPNYASEKDQDIIHDWLGIGFAGVLLTATLIETRAQDTSLIIPILFYLCVLAVCVSGVYWWIPSYIPKTEQTRAITILFLVVNLAVILTNSMSPAMKLTVAGRRK